MVRYTLIVITCLFSPTLFAQQNMTIPAGGSFTTIYEFAPGLSPQQLSFDVNSDTTLMIVDVHTSARPENLTIVNPAGIVVPPSDIDSFTVEEMETPLFGAALFLRVIVVVSTHESK